MIVVRFLVWLVLSGAWLLGLAAINDLFVLAVAAPVVVGHYLGLPALVGILALGFVPPMVLGTWLLRDD
ncbi:MAG: hypothetical protein KY476_00590 [Planctomycetes bacterium]|nr:hypothetical protein [Planctomycetota bacterium]